MPQSNTFVLFDAMVLDRFAYLCIAEFKKTFVLRADPKKPLFYLIACLLPFIFLLILEIGLRMVGFGQSYPLFIPSNQFEGYLQPNPNIIQRYFVSKETAPKVSPDTVYFPIAKGEDVFRIVIQGGSSAGGFPYGRFGSLQGMLEQRFKRTYPDKRIEIINTAMAAVNTYSLLDFVDEIIAIEPDAVLIYAGHNEYLGVLGAGSVYAAKGGRAATLLLLKFKDLRLYQLLAKASNWIQSTWQSEPEVTHHTRTLMTKVARGKHIPLNSDLYHLGITQFEQNLELILGKYRAAQIPVLLGNLVSNEKDLVPFSSIGKVDWKHQLNRQWGPEDIKIDEISDPASKAYLKAVDAQNRGRALQAKEFFQAARDLDSLRFRAPSEFNNIIEKLALSPTVQLVDVEQYFRRDLQDGLIGETHMLEHVHPTARGYFLLSEAFYQALVRSKLLGAEQVEIDSERAFAEIPMTEFDIRWADLKIAQLTSDYPFTAEVQPVPEFSANDVIDKLLIKRAQGANWLLLQEQLIAYYRQTQQWPQAAKVAGILADALPDSELAYKNAAGLYRQVGDIELAIYYMERALDIDQNSVERGLNLAHLYFLKQDYDKSLTQLMKVESLAENKTKVRFFIDKVKLSQKQKQLNVLEIRSNE